MARRALIPSVALIGLLVQCLTADGQQNNNSFQTESLQYESTQIEGFKSRLRSAVDSRGLAKRNQRKSQSCPPAARRRLFALRRSESNQVVDHPRLAEVVKSRESLRLVEGDWQAMTFERGTARMFQSNGYLSGRPFSDVPHVTFANLKSLPLAVRQSQSGQQRYFYLANSSPWRLRVQMQLPDDASKQTIENIQSLTPVKFRYNDTNDARVVTVDLEPYDLVGGWAPILGPIESYSFEYLDDVASDLRKRVFALQIKLQQAQQNGALRILSNPKFLADKSNRGLIRGWEIGQQTLSRFQLHDDKVNQKTTGKQPIAKPAEADAIRMDTYLQIRSSADEVTWIRSQPIPPTETERLSISVWLRVSGDTRKGVNKIPQVRIAIDGQTPADDYYRFGVVGSKPAGREPVGSLSTLGIGWKRFAVHFDDLPCSLTDLRIGFDVVGEGVVDIGQVELFDRWFDNGDAKRITQLLASADEMLRHPAHFDRCRRLLGEPWAVFLDEHFLLKPVPKSAQQPVPMFRPKVTQASATKPAASEKENGEPKVGVAMKAEQSSKR